MQHLVARDRWLPIEIWWRYVKCGHYHSANALDTFMYNVNWRWHHISQKVPHSAADTTGDSTQHAGASVCSRTQICLDIVLCPSFSNHSISGNVRNLKRLVCGAGWSHTLSKISVKWIVTDHQQKPSHLGLEKKWIYLQWSSNSVNCIVVGSQRKCPRMHSSLRLIVQTLVFSRSYLHRQVSPPETQVLKGGTTWARNGR